MILYINGLYHEDGTFQKAHINYENGQCIDISTEDGEVLILRMQPDDLLALADAVRGAMLREMEDKQKEK
jgi:hypothetical protein